MFKKDLLTILQETKSYCIIITKAAGKNVYLFSSVFILYLLLFFVDPTVRYWFSEIHTPFFDTVFSIGHFYGKLYIIIVTIIIFYVGGLIFRKGNIRIIGLKFFESFFISGVIVTILKSLLGRWRPYTEHGNFAFVFFTAGPNEHLSLPSGDVAVAFAFSTVAASLIDNKLWKIFWYLLAVLTFLGRIYHDQHWFTDVIMAAIISVSVGLHIGKQKIPEPLNNE